MKTGKIEFILSNVGSKSEKMQPFLKEADGNLVEVFKESDNPFVNESLKEYEGKTVNITGEQNEYGLFIIKTIEVIEDKTVSEEEAPIQKASVEIIEEKTVETSEQVEESTEPVAKSTVIEDTTEEVPKVTETEKPLKGFKKFLAFFHRK